MSEAQNQTSSPSLADARTLLAAGYTPKLMVVGAVAMVVVSAVALLLNRWLWGKWCTDDTTSRTVFALLLFLACAFPFVTARLLIRNEDRGIPKFYWVQSAMQLMWLFYMVWISHPAFSFIAIMLFLSTVVNDTRYFYDSKNVVAVYVLTPLFLIVGLLCIDFIGGEGVLARRIQNENVDVLLAGYCIAACIAVFVNNLVGGQWRNIDEQNLSNAELRRQLEVKSAEQEAIRQASDFLETGLSAGRFTHDVASPLSTLRICLEQLHEGTLAPDVVVLMQEAVQTMLAQQGVLAEAIRGRRDSKPQSVEVFVNESVELARQTGARLVGKERFAVTMELEPATLFIAQQHAGAVADLISNGVRQSENIHITGRLLPSSSLSSSLYLVEIRDFGVEGQVQLEAAKSISARLSSGAESSSEREGLGIGLAIARLTALRFGGSLSVHIPEGRGLCLQITIPTDVER